MDSIGIIVRRFLGVAVFATTLSLVGSTSADDTQSSAIDSCRNSMEARAKSKGQEAHPMSLVELVELQSEKVESATDTQVKLRSEYDVHMKGGIIGKNRFLVGVIVKGKLNKVDGSWKCTIEGATVTSDTTK